MKVLISAMLLTISMTLVQLQANAQNSSVAIGDATPKSNAVLYLKSPGGNQGLIIPVVSTPGSFGEAGMVVYGSIDKKVFYHDGAGWTAIGTGSGGGNTYTLSISGNNLILKDASSTVSTVPIAATAPTAANEFLMWDGAKWISALFSQDATNANGAITVNGIKGKAIPALPSSAQALVYNGTAWVFQALTGGTDSQDLTLNTTSNVLSLTNDATTVDLSPYKQTLSSSGTGTVANGESFPVALSSGGGTVTIKEGTNVQIDQASNVLTINSVAAGSGTVTNVSVASANGVSGTVTNPTTTPAITVSLGAITPTSVAATGTVTGTNISGTNTGDNAVNTLYSGLVSNATHTGDATGATALTVKGINGVLLSGLGTGILKNTTGTGVPSIATGADLPVMTATVGGAVPTPPNNTTTFLRGDGTFATPSGGGTLTAVSVTTANGFSGTSSGGSTPAITLTTPVTGILKGNGTSMTAALNSDLPAMTATVGGAVPTPPNNTTTFLRGDGTFATPAGGGTVTAVSVATANGFSGSSSGGATPALTIVAGAITPTSVAATGTVTGSNLSGTNTGDNAVNALYSGLVTNATHTGDATGATALTVKGINNVLLSGLGTGILKNTTGTGVPSIATGADLPVMTATVGGAVPAPPNNTTTFLRGDGTFAAPAAGGTVTTMSVVTANGVSGVVATPTTTPAVTLTLGAITPTSVAATGTVTGSNLSGTNTGDNAVNTLYSGLVSNATHTGDATGATALTVKGINNVLLSGLGTGILKNTTGTGVPSIATGADLPVMTATVGGAVPTPPNDITTFLRGDGTFAVPSGSSGWGLSGNALTTFGTNFIGTSDNVGLSFKTNNLQRMYINNLGQMVIDINNSNPIASPVSNAILDIVPNGTGIGNIVLRGSNANPSDPVDIEFRNWSGATTLGKIYINPSASDMWFDANGATRLALKNDGTVGIGTTSPTQKLDVVGNITIGTANSYYIGTQEVMDNAGTANIFVGGNNANTSGSNHSFFGRAAGAGNTTGTDNTFIGRNAGFTNSTGSYNTMVGTNAGQLFATGNGNTIVGFQAGNSFASGDRNTLIGRESDISADGITNATAIGYQAIAGANNVMVLGAAAGTGNELKVGIGTTTPTTELQVNHGNGSPAAGNGLTIQNVGASNQNFALFVSNSTGNLNLYDNTTFVGGFAQVTGTYTPVSDRRFKKNIVSIEEVLPKLSLINIRRYHFKKQQDNEPTNIGVIAQELKEIYPEMVHYSPENDRYTVDYQSMGPLAIKAIQEQQEMIEKLLARISGLESSLVNEKAEKVELKAQLDQLSSDVEQIRQSLGLDKRARKD